MNLYLISQKVNEEYDTYDSFVVCAENEEDARRIHPLDKQGAYYGEWVQNESDIEVKYLGIADKTIKRGEILGSFNAG